MSKRCGGHVGRSTTNNNYNRGYTYPGMAHSQLVRVHDPCSPALTCQRNVKYDTHQQPCCGTDSQYSRAGTICGVGMGGCGGGPSGRFVYQGGHGCEISWPVPQAFGGCGNCGISGCNSCGGNGYSTNFCGTCSPYGRGVAFGGGGGCSSGGCSTGGYSVYGGYTSNWAGSCGPYGNGPMGGYGAGCGCGGGNGAGGSGYGGVGCGCGGGGRCGTCGPGVTSSPCGTGCTSCGGTPLPPPPCPDRALNQPPCYEGCIPPRFYGAYTDPRLQLIVFAHPIGGSRHVGGYTGNRRGIAVNMRGTCGTYAPRAYIPAPNVPGNGPQLLGCMSPYSPAPESEGQDCPNYIFNSPAYG